MTLQERLAEAQTRQAALNLTHGELTKQLELVRKQGSECEIALLGVEGEIKALTNAIADDTLKG